MTQDELARAARTDERRRRYVWRLVKRIEEKERSGVTLDPRAKSAVMRAKSTRGHAFTRDPYWSDFILLADLLGCAYDFPKIDSDAEARR